MRKTLFVYRFHAKETKLSQLSLFSLAIGPKAASVLQGGKLPVRTRGVRRVLAAEMLDFSTKKASICSQISILRNNFVELEAASPIYLSALMRKISCSNFQNS